MDETYIKIKGKWIYLYRAVDKSGNTIDFTLSEKLDTAAVTAFLKNPSIQMVYLILLQWIKVAPI
jgi:putative transposase